MSVYLSPVGNDAPFMDANGVPYVGAQLFFYVGGSVNTKQTTYTTQAGSVANSNPMVLSAAGWPAQMIWLTGGVNYKIVLAPATDTDPPTSPIKTWDVISGINDASVSIDQWVAGAAPTYVSATSFTLVGDQTSTYHVGRRLKTTNSGGTVYSTIITSVFGALTTITVANDSGSLDSGLSAVSYSLVSAVNPSIDADMIHRKGGAVPTAATTNIWGIAGDYVHITGIVTVTSFGTAPYAGAERWVIADGICTITHNATTLQCPGGANIFTAAGDRFLVKADTTANMIIVDFIRAAGTPVVGTSVPRSYLAGLALSTAGGSATMTVAAGQATDSTNAVVMNLASSIGKTTSAWAVGTGNGGLDTGAIANTTWYHFYEIMRPDTGVVDLIFSLSASAPTMPANYSYKRRIGAGKTDGSAQWILFTQTGDNFLWSVPVSDFAAVNPTTAAVTRALTVPTGVVVLPIISILLHQAGTGANTFGLVTSLAQADTAPSATLFTVATGTDAGAAQDTASMVTNIATNTSAQIRTRLSNSGAGTTLSGATHGWTDRRGRDD